MSSEPLTAAGRRVMSYEELGARRHHLISERLRERRRTLDLTQKEVVARLRRMGVATSNKALSALEHGAGLDVAKLPEIARALECSLTYLVGLTDDPESWEPDFRHWPGRHPATPAPEAPGAPETPEVRRAPGPSHLTASPGPSDAVPMPASPSVPAPAPRVPARRPTDCPPILGPLG